jgi:hypothetical protein
MPKILPRRANMPVLAVVRLTAMLVFLVVEFAGHSVQCFAPFLATAARLDPEPVSGSLDGVPEPSVPSTILAASLAALKYVIVRT